MSLSKQEQSSEEPESDPAVVAAPAPGAETHQADPDGDPDESGEASPAGQRDGLLAILSTPGMVEWAQWASNAGLDLTKMRNDMKSARMVADAAKQEAAHVFALEREKLQNQADQAKTQVAEREKVHSAELEKIRLEARMRYQNDRVRSIVLLAVVLALVLMPVFAMFSPSPRISPEEFTQYIAPIVGIAGTVLGYWFGKQEKSA